MKKPIPKLFRDWLSGELSLWQDQRIIQPSQAGEILAFYETEAEHTEKTKTLAFYSLISAASVLAGISFLLFLGYNWDFLGYIPRLAILFGITIGMQAGAMATRFVFPNKWLSEALSLAACIGFGTSIFLIAQTFNLQGKQSEALWWCILGCIPVAFLGQSTLLWALVTFLEIVWSITLCFSDKSGPWHFAGFNTGLPSGPYLLPLFLAPGFIWAYLKQDPITLVLQYFALALGTTFLFLAWNLEISIFLIFFAFAALAWTLGSTQGNQFTRFLGFSGVVLSIIALIGFSYHDNQVEFFKTHPTIRLLGYSLSEYSVAVFPASLVILSGLFFPRFTAKNRKVLFPSKMMLVYLLLLTWTRFSAQYLPTSMWFPLVFCILANALILIVSAKWMDDGWTQDNSVAFFTGSAFFLLWTILRYFDLFGDVGGMLGASALFFASALALIFLAIFWRRRKGAEHAG